jgi:hypothetical protein
VQDGKVNGLARCSCFGKFHQFHPVHGKDIDGLAMLPQPMSHVDVMPVNDVALKIHAQLNTRDAR